MEPPLPLASLAVSWAARRRRSAWRWVNAIGRCASKPARPRAARIACRSSSKPSPLTAETETSACQAGRRSVCVATVILWAARQSLGSAVCEPAPRSRTRSACSRRSRARATAWASSPRGSGKMPAVSVIQAAMPSMRAGSLTQSRVVPAISCAIDAGRPSSALASVLLPAFGGPAQDDLRRRQQPLHQQQGVGSRRKDSRIWLLRAGELRYACRPLLAEGQQGGRASGVGDGGEHLQADRGIVPPRMGGVEVRRGGKLGRRYSCPRLGQSLQGPREQRPGRHGCSLRRPHRAGRGWPRRSAREHRQSGQAERHRGAGSGAREAAGKLCRRQSGRQVR